MDMLNVALAVTMGLALVMGLFTDVLHRRWISEPALAMGVGVLVGPAALGWLDVGAAGVDTHQLLEQAARLTLAVVLISVAIQLPHRFLLTHWRAVTLLVGPVMVGMWLTASALLWLVLGLDVLTAALIGAVLTPTDPVLAGGIVAGRMARRHLPARMRNLVSAESGANDGAAYLLLMLPVLLMVRGEQAGGAGAVLGEWLLRTLLWEVTVAVVVGAALGYVVGRVQNDSARRKLSEPGPLLSVMLALCLMVTGLVRLLGSDEILSIFAAGVTLDLVRTKVQEQEEHIQRTVQQVVQVPVFVLLGAALPWAAWAELGGWNMAAAVAVLALRRLPVVWLMRRRLGLARDEAAFAGWFGPIGVAAIYYAMLAEGRTGSELVWPVASLVIAASVLAHGFTATPLSHWLGRRQRPGLFDARP